MSENLFLDKIPKPTPALFARALGARAKYWDELKAHVPGPVVEEWKHYGKGGWALKLFRGKRNLLFVSARRGYFYVSFVLGDKAVALARTSNLDPDLLDELLGARKFAEGRGIRIAVKSRRALEQAKRLLDIKLAA